MNQEKPVVLYVDDSNVNLILFKETFKKDYEIIQTEYPKEALKILDEREIQVIVSDQRMPEMTGTELLEIVAEKHPNIRRYLLTAFTDAETVIEAVNVGRVHGYIKKPFKVDEVRASINSSIEIYQLKQNNQRIHEELELANAELLNLDGLKSEIINSIINEISNPLNRIMGTLHLLKSKIEGDELSEVVNILDHSVFNLEQFSMLARQISTLKAPGFSLEKQEISMNQVIQFTSIETLEDLKEQDINLSRDSESGDQEVKGDSDLLVSSLVNLIRFAKDHTGNKDEIVLATSRQNGMVECLVEDGGSNYSDALFGLLTDQFSIKDTSLNLTMGIGLAVSQMIMEAHGGHLIFEKTKEAKGRMKMVFPHE
jgi:two-component system sensor histidine kinase/response regulator